MEEIYWRHAHIYIHAFITTSVKLSKCVTLPLTVEFCVQWCRGQSGDYIGMFKVFVLLIKVRDIVKDIGLEI